MKLKVYRPAILVVAILFLFFAAAIAFEATTEGLSKSVNRRGDLVENSFFVWMKTYFGEFVARYFLSLPFVLIGISLFAKALKPISTLD
ncbi:MAG: hypothetical protein JNK75_01265 [Betaproteobacteria bacterium]|nr:hypothetical protein [Betaproteobacteria bacterium]